MTPLCGVADGSVILARVSFWRHPSQDHEGVGSLDWWGRSGTARDDGARASRPDRPERGSLAAITGQIMHASYAGFKPANMNVENQFSLHHDPGRFPSARRLNRYGSPSTTRRHRRRSARTGWNARSRWQVLCRKVPGGTLAQTGEQQTLFIPWLAFESLVAHPS